MIERTYADILTRRRALFSECGKYRYLLEIVVDSSLPVCTFIGLNPSTATELKDDPTIRRCRAYAMSWGCGTLRMLNLFAYRDTDPKMMLRQDDPIGPENTLEFMKQHAGLVTVAAWGKDGKHLGRGREVRRAIPNLTALRISEQTGQPWHPLYLPADLKPRTWSTHD